MSKSIAGILSDEDFLNKLNNPIDARFQFMQQGPGSFTSRDGMFTDKRNRVTYSPDLQEVIEEVKDNQEITAKQADYNSKSGTGKSINQPNSTSNVHPNKYSTWEYIKNEFLEKPNLSFVADNWQYILIGGLIFYIILRK